MSKEIWWQKRYATLSGVNGYFETYGQILTPEVSLAEVETMLFFLEKNNRAPNLNSSILDGFCGNGRHAKALTRLGLKDITAFDYSDLMLEQARINIGNKVKFCQQDARNLDFNNESFDLYYVLGNSAIGFFDEPSENQKVVDEARRVLKKGGVFVFDLTDLTYAQEHLTPHVSKSWEGPVKVIRERNTFLDKKTGFWRTGHTETRYFPDERIEVQNIGRWLYTEEQVKKMLQEAGFSDVHVLNRAFDYSNPKNPSQFGTMGIRSLYMALKV